MSLQPWELLLHSLTSNKRERRLTYINSMLISCLSWEMKDMYYAIHYWIITDCMSFSNCHYLSVSMLPTCTCSPIAGQHISSGTGALVGALWVNTAMATPGCASQALINVCRSKWVSDSSIACTNCHGQAIVNAYRHSSTKTLLPETTWFTLNITWIPGTNSGKYSMMCYPPAEALIYYTYMGTILKQVTSFCVTKYIMT